MKKEILIIIVIIVAISIGHAITQVYTQKFFENISEDLDKIEEKIFSNSLVKEELEKDVENIENKWNDKYNYIACFIEHDELEKVQTQLVSIKANIKTGNYDKSIEESEKCKFMLTHIEQKDSLKIVNIF